MTSKTNHTCKFKFAPDLETFPNVIFKATTEGHEKVPRCSSINFQTLNSRNIERRVLWCFDAKTATPIDWSMKDSKKKMCRCASFTNLGNFNDDSPALVPLYKLADQKYLSKKPIARCKSELSIDEMSTNALGVKSQDQFLESVKLKAIGEANIFSMMPRDLPDAMAPSVEVRIVFNIPQGKGSELYIYHVNEAWEELIGHSHSEVVGLSVQSFQVLQSGINTETQSAAVLQASSEAIRQHFDISLTLVCRRRDGCAFVGRVRICSLKAESADDGVFYLSTISPCKVIDSEDT